MGPWSGVGASTVMVTWRTSQLMRNIFPINIATGPSTTTSLQHHNEFKCALAEHTNKIIKTLDFHAQDGSDRLKKGGLGLCVRLGWSNYAGKSRDCLLSQKPNLWVMDSKPMNESEIQTQLMNSINDLVQHFESQNIISTSESNEWDDCQEFSILYQTR